MRLVPAESSLPVYARRNIPLGQEHPRITRFQRIPITVKSSYTRTLSLLHAHTAQISILRFTNEASQKPGNELGNTSCGGCGHWILSPRDQKDADMGLDPGVRSILAYSLGQIRRHRRTGESRIFEQVGRIIRSTPSQAHGAPRRKRKRRAPKPHGALINSMISPANGGQGAFYLLRDFGWARIQPVGGGLLQLRGRQSCWLCLTFAVVLGPGGVLDHHVTKIARAVGRSVVQGNLAELRMGLYIAGGWIASAPRLALSMTKRLNSQLATGQKKVPVGNSRGFERVKDYWSGEVGARRGECFGSAQRWYKETWRNRAPQT